MTPPLPEKSNDKCFAYRQSRKAFIAACEKAGADVVGRVHPGRGPDGAPLFLDAAAFGPRQARSGVLVVAEGASGAAVLMALLADKVAARLGENVRLVLVHGADPAGFAWNDKAHSDSRWGAAMLRAVVSEDLRQAQRLAQVGLGAMPALEAMAGITLSRTEVKPGGAAKPAILAIIAAAGA